MTIALTIIAIHFASVAFVLWKIDRSEKPMPKRQVKPLLPEGCTLIGRPDGRFDVRLPCGEVLFTDVGWTVNEAANAVSLAVETTRKMRELNCEGR